MKLRKLTNRERTGVRGKELTCPHCGNTWLAGHLAWVSFTCTNCKTPVDKLNWLCKKD